MKFALFVWCGALALISHVYLYSATSSSTSVVSGERTTCKAAPESFFAPPSGPSTFAEKQAAKAKKAPVDVSSERKVEAKEEDDELARARELQRKKALEVEALSSDAKVNRFKRLAGFMPTTRTSDSIEDELGSRVLGLIADMATIAQAEDKKGGDVYQKGKLVFKALDFDDLLAELQSMYQKADPALKQRYLNDQSVVYDNNTALGRALNQDNVDIAQWLIKQGAAVNVYNGRGLTPLMQAAASVMGQITIPLLLDHGADPSLKRRDKTVNTAYQISIGQHQRKAFADWAVKHPGTPAAAVIRADMRKFYYDADNEDLIAFDKLTEEERKFLGPE